MHTFDFATTKRIISRPGSLDVLQDYCQRSGNEKVLIITDQGIVNAGLLDKLSAQLRGIEHIVFSDVTADPAEATVIEAAKLSISAKVDMIIGFGGGSSMDTAKLVAVLASQQQTLHSMYGIDQITSLRLPLVLIPTTAGTGSEVTPISIVTTGDTTKAGIVSPILLPDLTLLDAELTLGLPAHVTAATGIDAMVHAIEAYTSKIKKNAYSDMLAKQALSLLSQNIAKATKAPDDIVARQNMLVGACLAGQAFANAPVAAVHALAYPLGGHFHVPHGLSNALVLPHVLRFNAAVASDLYAELAPIIVPALQDTDDKLVLTNHLIDYLARLAPELGLVHRLRDVGVAKSDIEGLAKDAMLQTRLLVNNPREVTLEDAICIYQEAW